MRLAERTRRLARVTAVDGQLHDRLIAAHLAADQALFDLFTIMWRTDTELATAGRRQSWPTCAPRPPNSTGPPRTPRTAGRPRTTPLSPTMPPPTSSGRLPGKGRGADTATGLYGFNTHIQ
ncbi:hypothetical protein [Streptomyces sp. AK08-02]|uniref:hypothetical protein n=1 Tax=Streptomyces sp. AK08-02 TaxID=3028654 RepID=UPI0029B1D776|nr:hypothetical protein [Streptomyces sp. AK08-02]MDX3751247.1 hypothetical protein [Streptomyces sp. AK08-02]